MSNTIAVAEDSQSKDELRIDAEVKDKKQYNESKANLKSKLFLNEYKPLNLDPDGELLNSSQLESLENSSNKQKPLQSELPNHHSQENPLETLQSNSKTPNANSSFNPDFYQSLEAFRSETDVNWNQFEDNEKLFRVTSSYDEKVYNTEYNPDNIPENIKEYAEKIERELKMTKSKSMHLNEERGITMPCEETEESEELRYSSVIRKGDKSANAYRNKFGTKKKNSFFSTWVWISLFILLVVIVFIGIRVNRTLGKIREYENQRREDFDEDEEETGDQEDGEEPE